MQTTSSVEWQGRRKSKENDKTEPNSYQEQYQRDQIYFREGNMHKENLHELIRRYEDVLGEIYGSVHDELFR